MLTRRELLASGLAAGAAWKSLGAADLFAPDAAAPSQDTAEWFLELAARFEHQRQQRFAAVRTADDLTDLQQALRKSLWQAIGGLPEPLPPPKVQTVGQIAAADYTIERLVFESLPGFFVPALLYRPGKIAARAPAVLCLAGHTPQGKVSAGQQILAANLARRGFIALATDPVGQGERSQFWDQAKGVAPFGLACGEHAVLGNPLYLLGASLARYEIWDAMRAIDLLAARSDVDPARIGCVGASGGGTQTAYVAGLDRRVQAAAIVCYITTLPRRMENRIAADPDSDPEQDLLGFVSAGIDHAGLLALIAPRPLLLGTAEFDFFPIEGARRTHAEVTRLYEACGQPKRIKRVEVPEKHGFGKTLREASYAFFERWLAGGSGEATSEVAAAPQPARELLVGASGQVSLDFHSRPLLELAWEYFGGKPPDEPRPLREILELDLAQADPKVDVVTPLVVPGRSHVVVCVAGNESGDWRDERRLLSALTKAGAAVDIVEPRLTGRRRSRQTIAGRDYADPLCGVEANLAYNAFLVGQSLVSLRVADVLASVKKFLLIVDPPPIVLCGRRDAALVCLLAAAIEPRIAGVAVEECPASFAVLFRPGGRPINAASVVPGLLRDYGDIADLVRRSGPERVLFAAPLGPAATEGSPPTGPAERFTERPEILTDWLARRE